MNADKRRNVSLRGTFFATKQHLQRTECVAVQVSPSLRERLLRIARNDTPFVALILALFIALAATYSIITPIFEGFDENWHFAFVQYIASGKGLPQQSVEEFPHLAKQEASQPPLYYALAAALTFWIPNNDTLIYERYNPQFQPVPWDYRDNKNIIVHTDAETFPWQGTALAVHLARFFSVVLGAGTVYCTYFLVRLLFPDHRELAFGAMVVNALTPSFIFTSALVSNDVLIVFLASISLVLLAKFYQSGSDSHARAATAREPVLLGIALGLAALTKLSGLGLWIFVGTILLINAWRTRNFRALFTVYFLATVISSWWYIRNWQLYGDLTGLNMMLDIMGRREPGFGFADLIPELEGIRRSYWALFGQTNIVANDWLYCAFDFLSLVACVGWVVLLYRAVRARRWNEIVMFVFIALWFAIIAAGLTRWALTTAGSQGRLLYPAISAASMLFARGWIEIIPHRISAMVVTALIGVATYIPFFVITPAYAQPEQLGRDHISNFVSNSVGVKFGSVELLGYRIGQEAQAGEVLWVDACWSSGEKIAEDDLVFVQLVEDNDLIAAQKDTYHGSGTFPTSQWKSGTMFCDRYPLRVRDTAPAAIRSQISIGLYRAGGERLQASVDGKVIGDNFRFAGPSIKPMKFDYEWGKQIALSDYDLDRSALRAGENFRITLTWRALSRLSQNHMATVQVMNTSGKIVGQNDSPVKLGTDERVIPVSPYADPGVYEIKLGVYQPSPIDNLPLYRDGRRAQGSDLVSLWWMRVNP